MSRKQQANKAVDSAIGVTYPEGVRSETGLPAVWDITPDPSKLPNKIEIVDPRPGTNGYTSRKRALKLYSQGRARFDAKLRLILSASTIAQAISADLEERNRKRAKELGYDHIERNMSADEMSHIPIVCISKALMRGSKRRKSAKGSSE